MGTLRLTTSNIFETAQTTDDALRTAKLRFYHEVGENVAPLETPEEILVILVKGHGRGDTQFESGDQFAYSLVEDPKRVTPSLLADLREGLLANEESFTKLHRDMRQLSNDSLGVDDALNRFGTAASFLRFLASDLEKFLLPFVVEFYKEHGGTILSYAEARAFFDALPPVKLFAVAQAYALWARAVRSSGYGAKRNAGAIDISSAVYLQYCDRFFTNDKAQYRALRFVNVFNPRLTRVEYYSRFRSSVLR